jgi:glycosyltransferase involved in cell wall biosynthesis
MPIVSVILPTYDRLPMLQEAVRSVIDQTFRDWELIIVDDGSTDSSLTWLETLAEPRIRLIRHEHTGLISFLRNLGVSHARGDWIAFLDSDDRWKPRKLERQLALHAQFPALRWSYTGRTMIDVEGAELPAEMFKAWEAHSGWILREVLTLDANIAAPAVMVDRHLLSDVGEFSEALRGGSDYELWLRLAERSECGLVDAPLVEVRSHRSSTFGLPDVNLGLAAMYRSFARRTPDPELRFVARRREALHAVAAANTLISLRRWDEARDNILVALRLKPLGRFAYRAAARLLWRRLESVLQSQQDGQTN